MPKRQVSARYEDGTGCRENLLDVLHLNRENARKPSPMLVLADSDAERVHVCVHARREVG